MILLSERFRFELRSFLHDLWPVLLAIVVFLVVVLVLIRDADAAHPWTPEVAERVLDAWPVTNAAALEFGVDPLILAAQAAAETGMRPIKGHYAEVWGPGQVSWQHHGGMIRAAGIADCPEMLLDLHTGLRAQAVVLRSLLLRYPRRRALCAYGVGWKPIAEKWTDCRYSRAVDRRVPKVLYVIETALQRGLGPILAALRRWFACYA